MLTQIMCSQNCFSQQNYLCYNKEISISLQNVFFKGNKVLFLNNKIKKSENFIIVEKSKSNNSDFIHLFLNINNMKSEF